MKFSSCIFFSLLLFQLNFAFAKHRKKHKHALITILLDGFRSDYLKLARMNGVRLRDLKGFKRVLKNGVEADYLQPIYPTNSIPNHYSLMTGLYSESHGMVDNWMFDPIHGTTFLLAANPESKEPYWWEGGDPLWITAQRQGKRSALYHWFGCDVEIHGLRPEHCTPNTGAPPSQEEMKNTIIEAVEQIKDGVDHAGIYVEEIDAIGHKYGLNHTKIIEGIQHADELLILLFDQLNQHNLRKKVDIMIFSDHGFTQIYPDGDNKKVVSIELDNDLIFGMIPGLVAAILPKPEHAVQVYQILQEAKNEQGHFDIYWKEEIPERWHYQNHYRIAPLIVQAHSGWILEWLNQPQGVGNMDLGAHGYVPESVEMRGIFYAKGPSFKRRFKNGPVSAVDLYQLMCHVLDLEPSPNNGTWSNVNSMLK